MVKSDCLAGWGEMKAADGGSVGSGTLVVDDGVDLHYRVWNTGSEDTVLIIHGLGGHGGWYNELGNSLTARGLSVIVPDLRGFGQSGGDRGHVRHGRRLISDIAAMAENARDISGGRRIHLLGHSMGAILAVHAANHLAGLQPLAGRAPLASLALVNPWLVDNENVSSLTVAMLVIGGLAGSRRLWRLGGGAVKMTDNELARTHLANDVLWLQEETSSFLFQVTSLRLKAVRAARGVLTPTLMIQGADDQVVNHDASRRLYEAIAAPDKMWAAPVKCQHDFQFGACRDEVDALLADWCLAHRG